jgi:hypothetical protein
LPAGLEPFGLVGVKGQVDGAGDEMELARTGGIEPVRGTILRGVGRERDGRLAVPWRLGNPGHALAGPVVREHRKSPAAGDALS